MGCGPSNISETSKNADDKTKLESPVKKTDSFSAKSKTKKEAVNGIHISPKKNKENAEDDTKSNDSSYPVITPLFNSAKLQKQIPIKENETITNKSKENEKANPKTINTSEEKNNVNKQNISNEKAKNEANSSENVDPKSKQPKKNLPKINVTPANNDINKEEIIKEKKLAAIKFSNELDDNNKSLTKQDLQKLRKQVFSMSAIKKNRRIEEFSTNKDILIRKAYSNIRKTSKSKDKMNSRDGARNENSIKIKAAPKPLKTEEVNLKKVKKDLENENHSSNPLSFANVAKNPKIKVKVIRNEINIKK